MESRKMKALEAGRKKSHPKEACRGQEISKKQKARNFKTIRRKKGRSWRPVFFARRGESVDSVRFFRAQTGLALGALLLLLALLREKTKHVGQFQRCSKSE